MPTAVAKERGSRTRFRRSKQRSCQASSSAKPAEMFPRYGLRVLGSARSIVHRLNALCAEHSAC